MGRQRTRIDLGRNSFGVTRWQYEELDDIDLLCEIGILSNCKDIGQCRACRHLLRFCISILMNRWDEFRYINFFDAMKVIKNSSKLFNSSIVLDHWTSKRKLVKRLIRLYRKNKDDPMIAINRYKHLFEGSIKINTIIKDHIQSLVVNNNPI